MLWQTVNTVERIFVRISTSFLTIIVGKLPQILIALQFRSRTFGDTQRNRLQLPVDEVNVARL